MPHVPRTRDPLREIPGVGPSVAQDLRDLGIAEVADLRGRDPEEMYEALCSRHGRRIDRCMLYVFRCATYYAGTKRPDPDKLLWWNWTDERVGGRTRRGR